jgi:hypothetical protein
MHHRIIARLKRESANEIAGFEALNLTFLAISNQPKSQKQTPVQSLRGLFTGDQIRRQNRGLAAGAFAYERQRWVVASISSFVCQLLELDCAAAPPIPPITRENSRDDPMALRIRVLQWVPRKYANRHTK